MRSFAKNVVRPLFKRNASRVEKTMETIQGPGTIKFQDRNSVSIETLQASMHDFLKNEENPSTIDAFRVFRNIVTYEKWMVPTEKSEEESEDIHIGMQVLENDERRVSVYTSREIWEKEKLGNHLICIEDLTTIITNAKIDEILIDNGTGHTLLIPKGFFPALLSWKNIIETEEALNKIRIGSEVAQQYMKHNKDLTEEQKEFLLYEPMHHLKTKAEFILVTRDLGDNKAELMMAPVRGGKRLLAAFTAPDTALMFTEKCHLVPDCTKALTSTEFFKQVKDIDEEIDGVHINCLVTDANLIHREMILKKEFIKMLDDVEN